MVLLHPGGMLGPIFAGWVHDRFHSYRPAFLTFAALNALALAVLATTRDERGARSR
jgi:cyanate permease